MKTKLLVLMFASQIVAACFAASGRWPDNIEFLTGECLQNTEMTYVHRDWGVWKDDLSKGVFYFFFDINDIMTYKLDQVTPFTYHVSPPNDVFKSFGKNKKIVKEEYQAVFHTLEELYEEGSLVDISVSTILYKEGLSLVANKKFAQYPAGENLAKYLIVPDSLGSDFYMRSKYNSPEKYGKVLDIPLDYSYLLPCSTLALALPVTGTKVDWGNVTFELTIPVKVVNYLQWINDKISNSDAPVPYTEEVLYCTFTTKLNFK